MESGHSARCRSCFDPLARFGWRRDATANDAPLFEGLGSLSRRVTTVSPEAQRYFDQGLAFLYAFNHDEAIRSFRRGGALDPNCAMA